MQEAREENTILFSFPRVKYIAEQFEFVRTFLMISHTGIVSK